MLGGPLRQAGKPAPGQVSAFCGATGTAQAQYHVAKGGRLVVRSVYHEVAVTVPRASSWTTPAGWRWTPRDSPTRPRRTSPWFKCGTSRATSFSLRHAASRGHQVPRPARHRGRRLAVAGAVPGQHVLGAVPRGQRRDGLARRVEAGGERPGCCCATSMAAARAG